MAASFVGAFATVSGCTALLGSFDVDNALSNDGSPNSDALSGSDGAFLDGGDAQVICGDAEVACGASCFTPAMLSVDKNNCGKCGRACGGSDCTAGACAPVPLYKSASLGPIAVNDTNVFFATSDNKLLACPKAGCTTAPTQIALAQSSITAVTTVLDTTLVFASTSLLAGIQRPAVFACPAGGCPPSPSIVAVEAAAGTSPSSFSVSGANVVFDSATVGLSWSVCTATGSCAAVTKLGQKSATAFDFDANSTVFYIDNGSKLASCSLAANCTPTSYPAIVGANVSTVQAGVSRVFWFEPDAQAVSSRLATCALPTCAMTSFIGPTIENAANLFVDPSGIYWTSAAGMTTSGAAKIQVCAGTCTGGPEDFATNLQAPSSLVADDAFIYWAASDGIYRQAKP